MTSQPTERMRMARLSAHGVELLRTDTSYPIEPDSGFGSVDARRAVYSYRSDGHIMVKRYVHFCATEYRAAYWHDYGWKLYKKFKRGVDLTAACERAAVSME